MSRFAKWLWIILAAVGLPAFNTRTMRKPVYVGLYWGILLFASAGVAAERFTVATYNVENYLTEPVPGRRVKSPESCAAVATSLKAVDADVVILQEMGSTNAVEALRGQLNTMGLRYPHWTWEQGNDEAIHLAVLSRFPIVRRVSHTNDFFLIEGRRQRVKRGLLEVEIEVNAGYRFTLFNVHFKSKRPVPFGDESEIRLTEAVVLRKRLAELFERDADANVLVAGDMNDTPDSKPIKLLVGGRKKMLCDLRPGERDVAAGDARSGNSDVTWTYYYLQQDSYSRFDYLLASRGMEREWIAEGSYVASIPGWLEASDHRPVVAEFFAGDK